jgi:hypothetical protein
MTLHSLPRTVAFACLLVALGPAAAAQPGASVETFDLVLVGDALSPTAHRVALKSNPTAGATWTPLDGAQCTGTERLMVVPDLSVRRYVGQDLRENYVALKIAAEEEGGRLRAAYAVPSTGELDTAACARLARLATTQPMVVRRHSLAVYERPRPARLRPGTHFIDHIEAPVRHRKPGVTEVEWLEILFRRDK